MPLRDTIVGAASGVVLLAGVVGFAVGLPEVEDEPETAASADAEVDPGTPVADLLPDTLLGGAFERFADINPELTERFEEAEQFSGDQMADAFGTDVEVAYYSTPDGQAQAAVTIFGGESGLFVPTGPPLSREMSANSQTYSEYVREGDSVCFGQWQTGAEEGAPPFQVQCQRVVDGRTINVYTGAGISVEQASDLVDDVASQAGLG